MSNQASSCSCPVTARQPNSKPLSFQLDAVQATLYYRLTDSECVWPAFVEWALVHSGLNQNAVAHRSLCSYMSLPTKRVLCYHECHAHALLLKQSKHVTVGGYRGSQEGVGPKEDPRAPSTHSAALTGNPDHAYSSTCIHSFKPFTLSLCWNGS